MNIKLIFYLTFLISQLSSSIDFVWFVVCYDESINIHILPSYKLNITVFIIFCTDKAIKTHLSFLFPEKFSCDYWSVQENSLQPAAVKLVMEKKRKKDSPTTESSKHSCQPQPGPLHLLKAGCPHCQSCSSLTEYLSVENKKNTMRMMKITKYNVN